MRQVKGSCPGGGATRSGSGKALVLETGVWTAKVVCLATRNTDPNEAKLVLGGDILVGKFHDVEKPTFMDIQREGILNIFSNKRGGGK